MMKEIIINGIKLKIDEKNIDGFHWELGKKNVKLRLKDGGEIPVPKEYVKQEGEKIYLK